MVKNFDFITSTNNTNNKPIKVWIDEETNSNGVDLIFTANNNINSHHDALSIMRNKKTQLIFLADYLQIHQKQLVLINYITKNHTYRLHGSTQSTFKSS